MNLVTYPAKDSRGSVGVLGTDVDGLESDVRRTGLGLGKSGRDSLTDATEAK
jgi:hypothetical protein